MLSSKRIFQIIGVFCVPIFVFFVAVGALYLGQRGLVFRQTSDSVEQIKSIQKKYSIKELSVQSDDVRLVGGVIAPKDGNSTTILYFGGQSEHVWTRATRLEWLTGAGYGFAFFSYRGYDLSEGIPSATEILKDSLVVYDAVRTSGKIVVMGYSLGTGPASYVASHRAVDGLIMISPYARLSNIAAQEYPWAPVRLLLLHEIDSLSWISGVKSSVLLLHGTRDRLIPDTESSILFENLSSKKSLVRIPNQGHGKMLKNAEVKKAILAFLAELK